MARSKYEGVIEAVRYSKDNKINEVRMYETRRLVFSDRIVIDRAELVKRLEKGKRIVTGRRKVSWGNDFETGQRVLLRDGKTPFISTEDLAGEKEYLTGVPVF